MGTCMRGARQELVSHWGRPHAGQAPYRLRVLGRRYTGSSSAAWSTYSSHAVGPEVVRLAEMRTDFRIEL